MFHRDVGQLPAHKLGSPDHSSDKMTPADLPQEGFVCLLGALRVDGQADPGVFPSRAIPWFHVSASRQPVSTNGEQDDPDIH